MCNEWFVTRIYGVLFVSSMCNEWFVTRVYGVLFVTSLCNEWFVQWMITSLGEERASLSAFRTFVRFVLVWICRFPFPLCVWEGLRFIIVALPGLFSYLFLWLAYTIYSLSQMCAMNGLWLGYIVSFVTSMCNEWFVTSLFSVFLSQTCAMNGLWLV